MPRSISRFVFRTSTAAVLAVALAAGAPAAAAGTITTLQPGVLTVCLYPNFAPFASRNPQTMAWSGGDVDFLTAFAASIGITQPLTVVSEPFDGIWKLPGDDQCDIAGSGITDLASREADTGTAGKWSAHYYHVLRGYLVRTADQTKLTGVCDLRGKVVYVTKGSTADIDLTNRVRLAKIPEAPAPTPAGSITIVRNMDEEAAAGFVKDGSAFAYGGGWGSVQTLASQGGMTAVWEHCNTVEDPAGQVKQVSEPFSFVVRAKSTGVLEALNAYINANINAQKNTYTVPLPKPDLTCPPSYGPPLPRSCLSMSGGKPKAEAKASGGRRGGS